MVKLNSTKLEESAALCTLRKKRQMALWRKQASELLSERPYSIQMQSVTKLARVSAHTAPLPLPPASRQEQSRLCRTPQPLTFSSDLDNHMWKAVFDCLKTWSRAHKRTDSNAWSMVSFPTPPFLSAHPIFLAQKAKV
eukprot:6339727-Amphidinium_carterae.1